MDKMTAQIDFARKQQVIQIQDSFQDSIKKNFEIIEKSYSQIVEQLLTTTSEMKKQFLMKMEADDQIGSLSNAKENQKQKKRKNKKK